MTDTYIWEDVLESRIHLMELFEAEFPLTNERRRAVELAIRDIPPDVITRLYGRGVSAFLIDYVASATLVKEWDQAIVIETGLDNVVQLPTGNAKWQPAN